jgi:endogenous inhibitor of DNA gyrase (YacG/DUF329 family)
MVMPETRKRNRKPCPLCGGHSVQIQYGLPGPEMLVKAEAGEIALGGCTVSDDDPNRMCTTCGHEWTWRAASPRPPGAADERSTPGD